MKSSSLIKKKSGKLTARQVREARELALAEALEALKPENAVRSEMIEARVRAGLTQAGLAHQIGTTQSAIARLESGGCSPTIKTLRKLAEVTGSRLVVRLDKLG